MHQIPSNPDVYVGTMTTTLPTRCSAAKPVSYNAPTLLLPVPAAILSLSHIHTVEQTQYRVAGLFSDHTEGGIGWTQGLARYGALKARVARGGVRC